MFDSLKNMFSSKKDEELYTSGFETTREGFGQKLMSMFTGKPVFDDAWFDQLLMLFIQSDVSLKTSQKYIKSFKKELKKMKTEDEALQKMAELMARQYGDNVEPLVLKEDDMNVILVVGVNGTGKTTTCAKLAYRYQQEGKKVLLVGGDTFRAAGSNQLKAWAEKIGVLFYGGEENQDPASVYVDAIRYGKEQNVDLVICDSAGRLQNKTNLMKELEKMKRVLVKEAGAIDHTYLVVDGNTGQNGISQAKNFTEVTPIDSLIVTKLDGSPKGGVLLSIKDELDMKVSYVGLGEGVEDLRPFEIESYLASLVFDNEL